VRKRQPPTILITGLRVNGEQQSVSILGETDIPSLDLNSGQRQITVDFIGLGASLGEKLKYEYRLGNAAWTATNERTLNFAKLGSGNYRFEVRAVTADKIFSTSPAVLSFKIAAPFWQRWWFLSLALLLIGGTAYLLYRNRLKGLLEVERMRTRIATDLHDDIGAELTKIALLSEVARHQIGESPARSDSPLVSIARISRDAVGTMSDIVWAINPQRDSLHDLVSRMRRHAEEVFTLRGIGMSLQAPEDGHHLRLNVDMRRDLFLIFKEAVNNAVRHSQCANVEIKLWPEGSGWCLTVRDDGVGFDLSRESEGHGLMSMQRRAKNLGGQLDLESNGSGGTTVKVRLPHVRRH
jgi:nitrate/nitrite-specific signal transduction histidine kinase